MHPDLADLAGRILDAGLGIDDPHGAGARRAMADQLDTAFVCAALRVAGGQLLVVETDGRRRAARRDDATYTVASARPYADRRAVSGRLKRENRSVKRRIVEA